MAKPTVEESKEIRSIQIEGLVVLQLVNHCQSCLPHMVGVTGQLLGLDVGNTLEVTASFPFLYRSDEISQQRTLQQAEAHEEELEQEALQYQYEMLRQLREVNVDSNPVGWYCSSWLEHHLNNLVVETQFSYQKELAVNCICLVYDPLKTTQGNLCLKAIRLRESFMQLFKNGDLSHEVVKEKRLGVDDIFEEIPIILHNNILVNVFVKELAKSQSFADCENKEVSSELSVTGYLTKTMSSLVENVEDLWQSYQRYTWDYRKLKLAEREDAERKPTKPSRLESMLISKQIINHCNYLDEVTMNNFENLYFADVLNKVSEKVKETQ